MTLIGILKKVFLLRFLSEGSQKEAFLPQISLTKPKFRIFFGGEGGTWGVRLSCCPVIMKNNV